MRKLLVIILFLTYFSSPVQSQTDNVPIAKFRTVMIPMRDGVKLKTIIRIPLDYGDTLIPVILKLHK